MTKKKQTLETWLADQRVEAQTKAAEAISRGSNATSSYWGGYADALLDVMNYVE